ncbi:MAG: glycosyltransferase family 2 protein [Chthoniobacteraceae bacterium]
MNLISAISPRRAHPTRKPYSPDSEARVVDDVTAMVLTYNEEANIGRTLERLRWVPRVIVIDSFSTDCTLEIVRAFPNVDVVQRKFDTFAGQCNFVLSLIDTEWVLSIDADYCLSKELVSELRNLPPDPAIAGYQIGFSYWVHGSPLRRTLLPDRTSLYRKDRAVYADEGHGHRVRVKGRLGKLQGLINHDDRKPLGRWLAAQCAYMAIEAPSLRRQSNNELTLQDRIRKLVVFAPVMIFFYTLFVHRLFLDGWRGWYYVMQRTLAELMLSIHLLDARMRGGEEDGERRTRMVETIPDAGAQVSAVRL